MTNYRVENADVLVVGGGGAGARAAIEASKYVGNVVLFCKGIVGKSGITPLAQWSIQAAIAHEDERDTVEQHFLDTVSAGRLLGDENLIEVLAKDAPERMFDLDSYGVKFSKKNGKFEQTQLPGQTYHRSLLLSHGGRGMMQGLNREVRKRGIKVLEDYIVTRLFKEGDRVVGLCSVNIRTGEIEVYRGKAVVLATGGHESLWDVTDCPPESVGDGFALAYDVGADLVDMEQLLFYPVVALYPESIRGMIIPYEACVDPLYIGGKLLNGLGEEFLEPGKPPVRDILIRKMYNEIEAGRCTERGGLFLDLTLSPKPKEEVVRLLEHMIGANYKHLVTLGIDPLQERIEIAPAAHYALGGIAIDEDGHTSVPGLYACGECAGNVQGANRLSGNALTETQVFGARAGRAAGQFQSSLGELPSKEVAAEINRLQALYKEVSDAVRPVEVRKRLQSVMQKFVGPTRDGAGLEKALAEVKQIKENMIPRFSIPSIKEFNYELVDAIEMMMGVEVAELVIKAALFRTESRGHHYRKDYPETDDKWLVHTVISKKDGKAVLGTRPVKRRESTMEVSS